MAKLTHADDCGKALMIDVSKKEPLMRMAIAEGRIRLKASTVELIRKNQLQKGDALGCARIAGICGAKRTSQLVPLCHNIALDNVMVDLELDDEAILVRATAVAYGKTGVEMEALCAVSVSALTIYDMCKGVDKEIIIEDIKLVEKKKEKNTA